MNEKVNKGIISKEERIAVYERVAIDVTRNCIVGNVFLTAFKFFAGFYAGSAAMVSDAVHSLSDILGSFIVIVGVKLANKKSDKEHLYGHERMECVAAIIMSVILFIIGLAIGYSGAEKIVFNRHEELAVPGALALVAAVASVVLKEAMFWYTRAAAKKIDSLALMAEAWHHRSDAMSSVGSFAGICGARLGFPVLDPMASAAICLFILKASADIFRDAVGKMTDRSCDNETLEEIQKAILAQNGVIKIDRIRTRLFGNRIYVDVEIGCDGDSTFAEAHSAAHHVHDAIETNFPEVKHCMVHVNPVAIEKPQ